jgi:F-type H+-transporting ATPase subunit epsilon
MAMPTEERAAVAATGGLSQVGGTTDMRFDPAHDHRLRVVIVTPEKAVLDERADFVVLPMVDGELGVLPKHAPLIGRVGKGELRVTLNDTVKKLHVEGGFAQIRSNVVTVLTSRVRRD